MPKKNMNWNNTIIYKIVCNDVKITDLYVGSTTNFVKRKCQHKTTCNNLNDKNHNINLYQSIRSHGGWDNWSMIEVEKYNAVDSYDAHKRERHYIETLEATLNKRVPTRSNKEYRMQNKDKIIESKKEYRELNKAKIREHNLKPCICMCGSSYVHYHKARHYRSLKHKSFDANLENFILQNNPTLDDVINFIK
jgi:hypothetical protein